MQWRELRDLLTGPERRRIDDILSRLNDPVRRAEELSWTLPDAIAMSRAGNDRVAQALGPTIDTVLKASVKKNPGAIADAIFPVLGPAIRKSIITTLMGMVQSLNHLLNQSLSLRGLKWRLEALRTHRPFAEVVLLHSLVYRVEQIFLIHRHTGVLLQHVASTDAQVSDPDLVSGMFTAIQDFVKDSFDKQHGEILDSLRMGGDHSVWIEQGPEAYLAVVLRGTPPLDLRERFTRLLMEIHDIFSSRWADFDGQVAPFAMVQPRMESELAVEIREVKRRVSPLLWLSGATAIAIVLLGLWQYAGQEHRWLTFLSSLRAEKGIVVTTARREWGHYYIEGLRDPLARDPRELMASAGLDPQQVHSHWEYYLALDDAMILRRARQILHPPAGVRLQLHHGVLTVEGKAPHGWVAKLHGLASSIEGVVAWDEGRLEDTQMTELHSLASRLSRQTIGFETGSSLIVADQQPSLKAAFSLIARMQPVSRASGIPIHLVVIGKSDPTGPELLNMKLSQARSFRVMRFFIANGIDPTLLTAVGEGSGPQPQQDISRESFNTKRIVKFQTFINGKEAGP